MRGRHAMTSITLLVLLGLLLAGAYLGWRALSAPVAGGEDDRAPVPRGRRARATGSSPRTSRSASTTPATAPGSRAGPRRSWSRAASSPATSATPRTVSATSASCGCWPPAARTRPPCWWPRQFGQDTFIQVSDDDLGAGVDVVVGDDYVGLVKAPSRITARAAGSGC